MSEPATCPVPLLFRRISSHDPAFFDVAERLAALS